MKKKINIRTLVLLVIMLFAFNLPNFTDKINNQHELQLYSTGIISNDDLEFNITSNDTVSVSMKANSSNNGNVLMVPSDITLDSKQYKVTEIKEMGFSDNTTISIVIIPSSVERISDFAFSNISKLTEVQIQGESLTSIGSHAFYACSSLEKINLPNSVSEIQSNAFADCTSLTSVVLPDAITKIEAQTFVNCTSLKTIKFSDNLISIGIYAFKGCTSLEMLYLPESLLEVASSSFIDCTNLRSIYVNSKFYPIVPNVFESINCPIIVSKDNYVHYSNSNNLSNNSNVTYVVDVEINFDGGIDSENNTSSTVHKLFNLSFDYFVDETTGIWRSVETDIYSNLPSNLKKFIDGQEFRLDVYTSKDIEISKSTVVDQEVVENGIKAVYEGIFKTVYSNDYHTITGISDSFITTEYLDIIIPTYYYDGINEKSEVIGISSNAFSELNFLTFVIEEGANFIGNNVFYKSTFTNAVVLPDSITSIGNNAFEEARFHIPYLYLNSTATYGSDIFKNVSTNIIAKDVNIYNEIKDIIDNDGLTYLIRISLDFKEGNFDGSENLVLERLYGTKLRYIKKDDLTWGESDAFTLPTPVKADYIFSKYVFSSNLKNTSVLNSIYEETVFYDDAFIEAVYDLQTVRSESADNSISGNLFFANGINPKATLEIKLNNESNLKDSVSMYDIYGMYSLSLLVDGEDYDPELGTYTLSLLLPEDMGKVVKYSIYMIEDGELIEITGNYVDGYIIFETSSLSDIALVNEPLIVGYSNVNESVMRAILFMSLFNIIEFAFIFQLNKGKRKAVVTYSSVIPMLLFTASNISLGILVALSATAIAQAVYICYLFATRNNTFNVQQQVDTIAANIMPSLEDLENIINESRKTIEELNEEYLAQEEPRGTVSIDDFDDVEEIENDEDDDENDEKEDEVRTRVNSTGQMVVIRFKKSFSARLNLAEDVNKDYHTMVKNKLLEYKKVNCRISWNHEAYNFGRNQAAKINVRGKTLFLYLPLNPNDYIDSKITFKDCSYIKKYEQLPFRLKIKSKRGLQNAFELIELVMSKFETSKKRKFEQINYYQKNRGFEKLLKEGLIKEIISADEYNELKEGNRTTDDNDVISNEVLNVGKKSSKSKTSVITVSHQEQKHTVFVRSQHQPFNPSITPISTESVGVLVRPKQELEGAKVKTNGKYEYTAVKGFNFDNYRN